MNIEELFEKALENHEVLNNITLNKQEYEWFAEKLNSEPEPEPNERLKQTLARKAPWESEENIVGR